MFKLLHHSAWCALLLAGLCISPAFATEQLHRGVHLMAFDAKMPTRGVARTRPAAALKRLGRAFDTLVDHSPANAKAIQTLRRHGTILLIYYPGALQSHRSLNSEAVALYLPNFLRKRGKSLSKGREFIVVINHIGIRWRPRELAGLIAHELVGHGGQHLNRNLANGRPIDLECEASLHEEQAYQDLRLRKSGRAMVAFRKRLETHHCADFRDYMTRFRPNSLALWSPRNPDVAALLREFGRYRRTWDDKRKRGALSRRNR